MSNTTNVASSQQQSTQSLDDRRSEPRYLVDRKVAVLPCTSSPSGQWNFAECRLIDCSEHGIAIATSLDFETGDEFLVKIHHHPVMLAQYRVRNCSRLETGETRVGAQFVGYISGPNESISLPELLGAIVVPTEQAPRGTYRIDHPRADKRML